MAHHVEARRDDADGVLLPPKRTVGFNRKLKLNDSLLAQSYVEAYDISYPDAMKRIEDEVRELKQTLEERGSYEFVGVGTIALNDDGGYEFTPCEAGILTPDLYGLSGVEIDAAADIKRKLGKSEKQKSKGIKTKLKINSSAWRYVAAACIAALAFLLFPSYPGGQPTQVRSGVDTRLLEKVMPKTMVTTAPKLQVPDSMERRPKAQHNRQQSKTVAEQPKAPAPHAKEKTLNFAIIVASHITKKSAEAYVDELVSRGYKNACVLTSGKHVKVILDEYETHEKAQAALNKINNQTEFEGAWVMKL